MFVDRFFAFNSSNLEPTCSNRPERNEWRNAQYSERHFYDFTIIVELHSETCYSCLNLDNFSVLFSLGQLRRTTDPNNSINLFALFFQ